MLVLGVTFKENCPDVRNSKVFQLIDELESFFVNAYLYDPLANGEIVKKAYGKTLSETIENTLFDSIIIAVPHSSFLSINLNEYIKTNSLIFDLKKMKVIIFESEFK